MIIKVSETEYINTDHIQLIRTAPAENDGDGYFVTLAHGFTLWIRESAAQWILKLTEADESLEFDEEKIAAANTPNLKAQIAQALRDTWKGATINHLSEIGNGATYSDVIDALESLQAEQVVIADARPNAPIMFYHVSNAPKDITLRLRPSPGLLAEDAPPPLPVQDDSAPTLSPNPAD